MSQSIPRPTTSSPDIMAASSHDPDGPTQMQAELSMSTQVKRSHVPTQYQDPPNATNMYREKDAEVSEQIQPSTSHPHQVISGPSLGVLQSPHHAEDGKLTNLRLEAPSSHTHSLDEVTLAVHDHNEAADLQAASPRVPDTDRSAQELLLHVDASKRFDESRHTYPDMVLSSTGRPSDGFGMRTATSRVGNSRSDTESYGGFCLKL